MQKTGPVVIALLVMTAILAAAVSAPADVEWKVMQTYKLETAPLDSMVSPSGKYLFVLTKEGTLQIYANGKLTDTLPVGSDVDAISAGPDDSQIFLLSKSKQTVDVVQLDYVQDIDIDGAAFKGNAEAPVALVIFSDFQ